MSQKIIIGVLAAVIVAGGGTWYYQSQSEDGSMMGMRTGESTSKKSSNEDKGILDTLGDTVKGTFTDIVGRGESVQCKFRGVDPETKEPAEGIVYASGENFYMEADTVVEGTELMLYVIQDDLVLYMWSDNEEAMPPIKMDMSAFAAFGEEAKPESPIDWLDDPEFGMEYTCRGWSPKRDSFTPPSDIEFLDPFGQMMGAFGTMMEGGMMGDPGMEGGEDYGDWGSEGY
jgi:hypothetical protein